MQKRTIIKFCGLLIFFSALGLVQVRVFYNPGQLFVGYDLLFHLNRIHGLTEVLINDQFPFYISPHFLAGYGYASNWFYSDLPLLPASIMSLLGLELVSMYKLYLIMITALTGLSMYYCTSKITQNDKIALLAATIYVLSNYRFVNLFIRSALGEALAFIILPFVLYGLYELLFNDERKWYILTFSFTALLFTHILSTLLAFTLLTVICIFNYKRFIENPKRLINLFFSGAVSIFTAAFFLFPFIEQAFTHTYWFSENPIFHPSGFTLSWSGILHGLFFNTIARFGERYFGLGITMVFPLVLVLFFFKRTDSQNMRIAKFFTLLSLPMIFMVSNWFPWQIIPIIDVIQFPWRLYGIVTLLLSISGAIYISELKLPKYSFFPILSIIVIGSITTTFLGFSRWDLENRSIIYNRESTFTVENSFHIGIGNEYLPIELSPGFILHRNNVLRISYNPEITTIHSFNRNANTTIIIFSSSENDTFELPLVYYVGYRAFLNGSEISVHNGVDSLVVVEIFAGSDSELKIVYYGTTIQRVSLIVSLVSTLLLVIHCVRLSKKIRQNKTIEIE